MSAANTRAITLPVNMQAKNLLHDFYGGLLTEKQSTFFTMHYMEDFSLAEIGGQFGVTPQAVADLLKRTGKLLDGYEEKLGLVKKLAAQKETLSSVNLKLNALANMCADDTGLAEQIRTEINELLL